jgi:predicted ATP-dependent protease
MPTTSNRFRLQPARLRWTCDPADLPRVGDGARAALEIIGQDRALDALRMGLEIRRPGYHIFVTGTEGTGRTTTIRRVLEEGKRRGALPGDLCYVHNFQDPEQPLLLRFPAGVGRDFKRRIERMTSSLRRHIPQLYRGESYQKQVAAVERRYSKAQGDGVQTFAERARRSGFNLVEVQSGPYIRPELHARVGGEEYDVAELGQLVDDGRLDARGAARMERRYQVLSDELRALVRANSRLDEAFREERATLAQSVILPLIHDSVEMLKSRFEDPAVHAYLEQLERALVDAQWIPRESDGEENGKDEEEDQEDSFARFGVNLLVDNEQRQEAPVIIETAPTFQNLFGNIEPAFSGRGVPSFDYRQIKAGSLVRAQGGTLVIMAQDLLEEAPVWPTLKRVLRNRKLEIQAYDPQNRMVIGPLKPQPIDLDLKVILVGDTRLYNALLQGDPDLQRVFRIKVDFETDMPLNRGNIRRYLNFIDKVCQQDKLLPLTPRARAGVLEQGARLAGRQDRLSTRFSSIVHLLIESDYFARREGARQVHVEHVDRAMAERDHRLGTLEEQFHKMVRDGALLINTKGAAIGQANGLFIMEQWDYAFGQPVRITASCSLGEGDILSIEREVEMSGASFDKGHMILEGFMRHRFAQDKPLRLHATISCEQNYIGVDGDSASATEVFTLMSALAGLPLNQALAVTGSVNQFGEVQPVGGLIQKIEGYFKVCCERGLTGEQGVIVPKANAKDLMLNKEIVAAARAGLWHVHAIRTVDEGLELLTGVPAGRQRANGRWPAASVNGRVDARLLEMAFTLQDFSEGGLAVARS